MRLLVLPEALDHGVGPVAARVGAPVHVGVGVCVCVCVHQGSLYAALEGHCSDCTVPPNCDINVPHHRVKMHLLYPLYFQR